VRFVATVGIRPSRDVLANCGWKRPLQDTRSSAAVVRKRTFVTLGNGNQVGTSIAGLAILGVPFAIVFMNTWKRNAGGGSSLA
jgi:hypothetical protein